MTENIAIIKNEAVKKSNKKSNRKKTSLAVSLVVCGRCGEENNTARVGAPHRDCNKQHQDPVMRAGVALLIYARSATGDSHPSTDWSKEYLGEDDFSVWMTKGQYEEFKAKLFDWMSKVRNFRGKTRQWENGFGQLIDFHTGLPLDIDQMEKVAVAA